MGKMRKILQACVFGAVLVLALATFPATTFAAAPGTVGAWQTDDMVPDDLAWTSATTYNGYIYLVAGANDFTYTNAVYFAKLGSDGSIGPWGTTTDAPYTGSSVSVVAHNGYMYYIGGFDGGP